ncbi:MAG: hypothetical protein ABIH23_30850 [bacterium]
MTMKFPILSFPPLRLWILAGAILILALLFSVWLTLLIADSRFDVGLDLLSEPNEPPILTWGTDEACKQSMHPIAKGFSTRKAFFELTPARTRNPDSSGTDVIAFFSGRNTPVQDPPGSWLQKGDYFVCDNPTRTTTLFGVTDTSPASLILLTNPHSGNVILRSFADEQVLDLYSRTLGRITIPLEPRTLVRYQANLPRRALSNLYLELGGAKVQTINRLYIGSWAPNIFSVNGSISPETWGSKLENWIPNQHGDRIAIPAVAPLEHGGFVTFLAVFTLISFFLTLLTIVTWLLIRTIRRLLTSPMPNYTLAPFAVKPFLAFFLLPVVLWLFWLACFFPAAMSPDSHWQWAEAQRMRIGDLHPAFHTLTIKVISLVWDSPTAVACVQILLLALALSLGLTLLLRAGISLRLIILVFLLALISPRNGNYAVVIWKDIFYTIVICLFTIMLARALLDKTQRNSIGFWILVGVLLGLTPLYRHNGIIVLLGIPPLLPLFFWPSRKRVFLAIGTGLILFCGVKYGLYPFLSVSRVPSWAVYWNSAKIAALLHQDVPFSQEEYEFLNQVRALDDKWDYHRASASKTIFSPSFNYSFASDHIGNYNDIHLSLILRYPILILRHVLQSTSSLYWLPTPGYRDLSVISWLARGDSGAEHGFSKIFRNPRISLERLVSVTEKDPWVWLFWRPALPLYLVLFSACVVVWRTREVRFLIVYLPVCLNTVSLVLGALAQDVRYQFPLTFTSGFLVCLAFLPHNLPAKRHEGEDGVQRPEVINPESLDAPKQVV